ncbi:MAG: long-chain fatty acid--CoA ligase [Myxococcota bacterium]
MDKRTINSLLINRALKDPDHPCAISKGPDGTWHKMPWSEGMRRIRALAHALRSRGVERGDRVAIISNTRAEWVLTDFSILALGAVTVGIYPTSTPDQVSYVLGHSGSKVVFVEDRKMLRQLKSALGAVDGIRLVVLMAEGETDENAVSLQALLDEGHALDQKYPSSFLAWAGAVEPDDVCTYVYTSGTTGNPKGAICTHGNFHHVATVVPQALGLGGHDRSMIFLPLAHSLQRYIIYAGLVIGGEPWFAESIEKLPDNLREAKPTILVAVPRLLEKVRSRVLAARESMSPTRKALFDWALAVAMTRSRRIQMGLPVGPVLAAEYDLAGKLVLDKIRERVGGHLRLIGCGSAPLDPAVAEFFHALGITVLEGYGLTETSAPATINRPHDFRFGTVGKPIPGVDIKLASDGEVLIRGPGNFRGYHRDREQTAAVIQDGWFHSGDIGELTPDGFLRITDRKKDLIKTSGGKFIAPQYLEGLLRDQPLIGHVVIYGDNKPFVTALITLDREQCKQRLGLDGDPAGWSRRDDVRRAVEEAVSRVNAKVARYESIKKHVLVPDEFTVEAGQLTPTLKLRRKEVSRQYAHLLEALYEGDAAAAGAA